MLKKFIKLMVLQDCIEDLEYQLLVFSFIDLYTSEFMIPENNLFLEKISKIQTFLLDFSSLKLSLLDLKPFHTLLILLEEE